MNIKAPFSFYGGKSKLVKYYPAPAYPLIIEPFAGAASYSWAHRDNHQVWLNDLDLKVCRIWNFLTDPSAARIASAVVPHMVEKGQKMSEIIADPGFPPEEGDEKYWELYYGLVALCQAEANQGTQGAKGVHDQVTSMGAKCWPIFVRKLPIVIEAVQNWSITNLSYDQLPNLEATWFIDPPYNNVAGKWYRQSSIDYSHLREWCLARRGQVIVTEQAGATWLPFREFSHGHVQISSEYQKSTAKEAMWVNDGAY